MQFNPNLIACQVFRDNFFIFLILPAILSLERVIILPMRLGAYAAAQSAYASVNDFYPSPHGATCTRKLKKCIIFQQVVDARLKLL